MFFKKVTAIRGAICCNNNEADISARTLWLFRECLNQNRLTEKDIISVFFSTTADLKALNPAGALRQAGYAQNCALFCVQEAYFATSPQGLIRILIQCYSKHTVHAVYLNGAESLRPDLYSLSTNPKFDE